MINLIQKTNEWVVTYLINKEVVHKSFDTIELAAEFMVAQGVIDDDIDDALCEMAVYKHRRAIFTDNKYARSEAL